MTDRYASFDEFLASFSERVPDNDWDAAETFVTNIPAEYREQFLSFLKSNAADGNSVTRGDSVTKGVPVESEVSTGATSGSSVVAGAALNEQVAHYNVLRPISRGGMGVVSVAQDIHSGELVALKMLRRSVRGENAYEGRLRRESQAIAALDHPNIVRLVDSGVDQDSTYLAMQLVDGVGLDRLVHYWAADQHGEEEHGPNGESATTPLTHVPIATCAETWRNDRFVAIAENMAKVADALHSAHANSISHRDVKPSNILIDLNGQPWLTDFGLASIGADMTELTQTGDVIGTPAYMSPEQASGMAHEACHLSDIYSLGVTLYELATLRKPFIGSRQKIIVDLMKGIYPLPSKIQPTIPKQLEAIICRAMALSPKDRYATAQDLAEDLRNFVEGHKVHARLPNHAQAAIRWCERNPTTTLVAFVAFLVITVGGFAVQAYNSWALGKVNEKVQESNDRLMEVNHALDRNKQRLRRELFIADMGAAFDAYNKNNVPAVRLLMSRYDINGEDRDLRGVPWNVLRNLTQGPESDVLFEHDGPAKQIVVSPDQRLVMSAGHDGVVRIVKLDEHGELEGMVRQIEVGNQLDSLAFDPIESVFYVGRTLPLGFNRASKFSLESGEQIDSELLFQNCIESIAVSPSGKGIAAAERYRFASARAPSGEVVNWENGSRNGSLEYLDEEQVLAVFQDPKLGRQLHLWNLGTNKTKRLKTPFRVENFATARGRPSDKPTRIVAAGASDICVVEWPSLKVSAARKKLSVRIRCVDISSDGTKILAGCDDGSVAYWDLSTQRSLENLDSPQIFQASDDRVTDVEFLNCALVRHSDESSNEVEFVTSADDGLVRRWSLPTQFPSVDLWRYGGIVETLFEDPENPTRLYVSYESGHLVELNVETMSVSPIGIFRPGFIGAGTCWPEEDKLFLCNAKGILVVDRNSGELQKTIPAMFTEQDCDGLVILHRELFACYHDHVLVIDLDTMEHKRVHQLPNDSADQMVLIPGTETILVRTAKTLYTIEDKVLRKFRESKVSSDDFSYMAYSKNGELLATVHHNHVIRVSKPGEPEIRLAGGGYSIRGLVFVDSDRTLVSSDTSNALRFWDLESRREIGHIEGLLGPPHAMVYIHQLHRLVALGRNRRLHIWDLNGDAENSVSSSREPRVELSDSGKAFRKSTGPVK